MDVIDLVLGDTTIILPTTDHSGSVVSPLYRLSDPNLTQINVTATDIPHAQWVDPSLAITFTISRSPDEGVTWQPMVILTWQGDPTVPQVDIVLGTGVGNHIGELAQATLDITGTITFGLVATPISTN